MGGHTTYTADSVTYKIKMHLSILLVLRLSESFKNICIRHEIELHLKGGNTIRNLLVAPKDKDTITQKRGVICKYKYGRGRL